MKLIYIVLVILTSSSIYAQLDRTDRFKVNYKLSDFDLNGQVKQIERTFSALDTTGKRVSTSAYTWGHVKEVSEFNVQGNLTRLVYKKHDGSNAEEVLMTYTADNKLLRIDHKDGLGTDQYMYKYGADGRLISVSLATSYAVKKQMYSYDDAGRIKTLTTTEQQKKSGKKAAEISTNGETDNPVKLLSKETYSYDGSSERVLKIEKNEGTETFDYNKNGVLIASAFKLKEEKDDGWERSTKTTYVYDGLVLDHFQGDSLVDVYAYSHSKNAYSPEGTLKASYSYYNGDGVFESSSKYLFKTDGKGNWIEKKISENTTIAHSNKYDDTIIRFQTRKITYYE